MLVIALAGRAVYLGRLKPPDLARTAAKVRESMSDPAETARLKMEQSTLAFQLPNLSTKYPVLADAVQSAAWSNSVALSILDADVSASWRAWFDHAAPRVQEEDPDLELFLALQRGYDLEVRKIAADPFQEDKEGAVWRLREGAFAALFNDPNYVRDRRRFDAESGALLDEDSRVLRQHFVSRQAQWVAAREPGLRDYCRALVELQARSDETRSRLETVRAQLGGAGQETVPTPGASQETQAVVLHSAPSGAFHTYIPEWRDFLLAEAAALSIGLVLSWPPDLRYRRWLKLLATAGLVGWGMITLRVPVSRALEGRSGSVFAFLGYLAPVMLLAATWTPNLTVSASHVLSHLLDSPGRNHEHEPNLGLAHRAARRGEFREALRLAGASLLEDGDLYEALVLKAKLHRRLNQRRRTLWALKRGLSNPRLEKRQAEHLRYLLRHVDDPEQSCWVI
ncbi:MAG: hypothetical protein U1F98_16795 [Verrucomicrobiota bacterium]